MTEFKPLLTHINKKIALTPEEENIFLNSFKLTKVKKRQFIVQPDFVAKHRHYVLEGAFRAYVVADEGQDHTVQFAVEDWWISDYNSYIYQQPATMFVVALEDSLILKIDYEAEQALKNSNPKFETFFRIMAESTVAAMQRRLISNLTQSAEERYDTFLSKYPKIANRVPQYALASFLGMTTEFLSKIRNKKTTKKS